MQVEIAMNEKFKVSLKAARVNAEMTQKEAGKLINKCRETIMLLESGKQKIKSEELEILLNAYKCPMDSIFLPINLTKSEE